MPESKPDEQKTEKIKTERNEEKKTAEEKKGPPLLGGGDWNGGLVLCPISARFWAVIRHQAEHRQGQRSLEMGRTGARRRAAEGMVHTSKHHFKNLYFSSAIDLK